MSDDEAMVESVDDGFRTESEHQAEMEAASKNTEGVGDYYSNFLYSYLISSPWLIVAFIALMYYVYVNYMADRLAEWKRKREEEKEAEDMKKNPDLYRARMEAVEKNRLRLQEKYNADASRLKEKELAKEEEKRKEKMENYEAYLKGETSQKKKNNLTNDDYNPLMGSGPSCSFRPGRRSQPAAGG